LWQRGQRLPRLVFGLSIAAILALLIVPDIRHLTATPASISASPMSPAESLTP